jgi:hypothetical protein
MGITEFNSRFMRDWKVIFDSQQRSVTFSCLKCYDVLLLSNKLCLGADDSPFMRVEIQDSP